jgi:hypothetical protein
VLEVINTKQVETDELCLPRFSLIMAFVLSVYVKILIDDLFKFCSLASVCFFRNFRVFSEFNL